MMETHEQAVKRGKKNRKSGGVFEARVRKDLEEKGWICDKWTNNVEFPLVFKDTNKKDYSQGRLIQAKAKFVYNPVMKRRIMIGNSSGFPDFITFSPSDSCRPKVIGVEAKINGILDKEERAKCVWLLDNHIFSSIKIARKTKVKNRIVIEYRDFEVKDE